MRLQTQNHKRTLRFNSIVLINKLFFELLGPRAVVKWLIECGSALKFTKINLVLPIVGFVP